MSSVRLSKTLRNEIVALALKDTKYATEVIAEELLGDSILKDFLVDMAGGEDAYYDLETTLAQKIRQLKSEVPEFFLSYHVRDQNQLNNWIRKTRTGELIYINLSGRQLSWTNTPNNTIVLKVTDEGETPFCPFQIYLEDLPEAAKQKWLPIFNDAKEKEKEFRNNKGKFISSLNNLLDENNTTGKIKKNCPELIKYLNQALEVKSGVSRDSAGKITDKSDLKVVLSELQ